MLKPHWPQPMRHAYRAERVRVEARPLEHHSAHVADASHAPTSQATGAIFWSRSPRPFIRRSFPRSRVWGGGGHRWKRIEHPLASSKPLISLGFFRRVASVLHPKSRENPDFSADCSVGTTTCAVNWRWKLGSLAAKTAKSRSGACSFYKPGNPRRWPFGSESSISANGITTRSRSAARRTVCRFN